MWYTVECSYNDAESEEEWNAFYSQQKLPALLSVTGFATSQRFRAVSSGCPVYLAIHTVKDAHTLSSVDYALKGAVISRVGRSALRTGTVTCMKLKTLLQPYLLRKCCY
jgi:hypothetical protein